MSLEKLNNYVISNKILNYLDMRSIINISRIKDFESFLNSSYNNYNARTIKAIDCYLTNKEDGIEITDLVKTERIAIDLLKEKKTSYIYFSDQVKDIERVTRTAIELCCYNIQYVSSKYANDIELHNLAFEINNYSYFSFNTNMKNNLDFAIPAYRKNYSMIMYATDEIKDCREIGLIVVEKDPLYFRYLSERLRNDDEICMIVLNRYESLIEYCSQRIRNDPVYANFVIRRNPFTYIYLGPDMRANLEIFYYVIKTKEDMLNYAPDVIKNNPEVIANAFTLNHYVYSQLDEEMANHPLIKEIIYKNHAGNFSMFNYCREKEPSYYSSLDEREEEDPRITHAYIEADF